VRSEHDGARVEHVGTLDSTSGDPRAAARRALLLERAQEIRRVVFVDEQAVSPALEWDGLDDEAEHFVAWVRSEAGPRALGTARLRRVDGSAKAERVAVRSEARGHGIGRALMAAIESRARTLGLDQVKLHGQVAVEPFYQRLGYEARGEVFMEAGIPHRTMFRRVGP
jgi:predicted GNAT family N-acyltransferase